MLSYTTTIRDVLALINEKKLSAPEVIEYYHAQLLKNNPDLNCALEVFDINSVLEQYTQRDYSNAVLNGIPGILKNNISQQGKLTTAGSKILENYTAPYNATVTERLESAGGVMLGRGNMDEFAMGSSGEFSAFGLTRNPWDHDRVPGGSSSGSAAAVASGSALWAIGTETGGSVRQPASFCNLVGLYPTYGLFSRSGILAFCSSTDQPGPLTKTVYDNALITSVLSGYDPLDATSLPEPKRDFTKNLDGKLPENLTLGVLKESLESDGVDDEVRETFKGTIKRLEAMGAKIEYVSLPSIKYGIAVYFILARAEAASNLSRYDGSLYGNRAPDQETLKELYTQTRHDGFGAEVKRRILMGNYVLSSGHRDAYYDQANHVRAMIRAEYEETFKRVDLLISPTVSTLPFKIGAESQDPLAMYMADYFTIPNCITGQPALSLPAGFSQSGLPIGFQFMGPRLSEELIYRTAYAFEQAHDFHLHTPEGL